MTQADVEELKRKLGMTAEQAEDQEYERIKALQEAGVSTWEEDRRAFELKRARVLRGMK